MNSTVRDAALSSAAPAALAASAPGNQQKRGGPPPGRGARALEFVPSSYSQDAHTVEVVLSAGTRVQRWYGFEEILIDPAAIDLTRVSTGICKALDSHNAWGIDAILGNVISARIENGTLIGVIRFAQTEEGQKAEGMVSRGEISAVSMGYAVTTWRNTEILVDPSTGDETYVWQAAAWTLLEVSFVSVPADPNAVVRSAELPHGETPANSGGANVETRMTKVVPGAAASETTRTVDNPELTPATPAVPAAGVTRFDATSSLDFMDQARTFGLDTEARTLVDQNTRGEISVETARSSLLARAAEKQRAGTAPALGGARAGDDTAVNGEAIVEAIVARATRKAPTDRARPFMGHRLLELAILRTPGLNPRERDAQAILRAANATGDFPNLLANAGNKILLERYNTATPTYQRIAGRRDLTDFKPTNVLRIGDFPTLQAYTENGEIKSGTVGESKESVTLGSYGRVLRLTRQAIVNDDLGAFDQMFANIGTTIGLFENALFFAAKGTVGPALSDGKAVFHSGHNNLAGSGAAIAVASIGAGRAAMRKQTNMDGNSLNLNPVTLFVGADKETEADQFVASITPRNPSDVNPFSGKLNVVCEGSISGNAWELYADPSFAPVWLYGYLADAPGPRVFSAQEVGFDGLSWQITEDFYAGAVDYRGGYRNPGA